MRVQARYGCELPGPDRVHRRQRARATGALSLTSPVLEQRPVRRFREQLPGQNTPLRGDRPDGVEQRTGPQPSPRVRPQHPGSGM